MSDQPFIDTCPVEDCDEPLQATYKGYLNLNRVRVDDTDRLYFDENDGYEEEFPPHDDPMGLSDRIASIYCKNDHTEAQMTAALKERPRV